MWQAHSWSKFFPHPRPVATPRFFPPMSRRTAPAFSDTLRWNSFNSARRHSHGHSFLPMRRDTAHLKQSPHALTSSLFEALDQARFDQVRRAISTSPDALLATSTPRTAFAVATSSESLSVLDYALNNCRTWLALIQHCQRTGIATSSNMGDFTFRERLSSMSLILVWLLSVPGVPPPNHTPLHTAVSCKFDAVCTALLNKHPSLATSTDARGKTPLHIACGMSSQMSPTHTVAYIRMLIRMGADINATDVEGRTPLHDLVTSLNVAAPAYGLVRRRRLMTSLSSVLPTLNEMLTNGADLHAPDSKGDSAMDVALACGVDYLVMAMRADWVYGRICETEYAKGACQDDRVRSVRGMWGTLPEDVVLRILRFLSPKDVVSGIGATCHGLRRVAVSKHLWVRYTTDYSMAAIRESLRRRAEREERTASAG